MTIAESRHIVSYLAPELPEELTRPALAKGLVMFAEDTSVDRDEHIFLFAPYPEKQHVTGDDEWGPR